jgi:hypothetical protein
MQPIGSFQNLPPKTQLLDMCSSTGAAVCHQGPALYENDLTFGYTCPVGANVSLVAWVVAELNTWTAARAFVGPPEPDPLPTCTETGDASYPAVLVALTPILLAIAAHLLHRALGPRSARAVRGFLHHSAPFAAAPCLPPPGDPVGPAWLRAVTCDAAAAAAAATNGELFAAAALLLSQAAAMWLAGEKPAADGGTVGRHGLAKTLGRVLQVGGGPRWGCLLAWPGLAGLRGPGCWIKPG